MDNIDKIIIGTCVGIGVICATIWYFSARLVENKKIIAATDSQTSPNPSSFEVPKDQISTWVEPTLIEKKEILDGLPWYVDACLSLNDFTLVIGALLVYYTGIIFAGQIILWGDVVETEKRTTTNMTFFGRVITSIVAPKIVERSRTSIVRWELRDVAVFTFLSRAIDWVMSLIDCCFNPKGKTLWAAVRPRQEAEIIDDKWETYKWWWSFFVKKGILI